MRHIFLLDTGVCPSCRAAARPRNSLCQQAGTRQFCNQKAEQATARHKPQAVKKSESGQCWSLTVLNPQPKTRAERTFHLVELDRRPFAHAFCREEGMVNLFTAPRHATACVQPFDLWVKSS